MMRILWILLLLSSAPLLAQEEGSTSGEVESLYQKEVSTPASSSELVKSDSELAEETKSEKLKSITQLETLAPFDDLAVIQRRYLPKTKRFEFNPNSTGLSPPFAIFSL